MNCWHCKTPLVWERDFDMSYQEEYFQLKTYLYCPKCGSDVTVWSPNELTIEYEEDE